MAKESRLRENRVKSYLINTGVSLGKDTRSNTVVSVKEQETSRLDIERLKSEEPEIYKRFLNTTSSYKMSVI